MRCRSGKARWRTKMKIGRRRRRRPHHRAASSRCTAQAARAGRSASRREASRAPRHAAVAVGVRANIADQPMPEHDGHRGFLLAFQKIEHHVRGDKGAGAGEVDGAGVRYPPCTNGRTINGWRNTTKRATKRRPAAEKSLVISARNGGMGGFPSPAPIISMV